ncbi:hypothetical protein Tco_0757911, partial [Tanacetum coccineum]
SETYDSEDGVDESESSDDSEDGDDESDQSDDSEDGDGCETDDSE